MHSHKWRQALVGAVLSALGLMTGGLVALQSTALNAQTKKESILGFEVAQAPTTPAATTPAATPASLIVDGVDVGKQVTDSIASLRLILSTITDAASAQAAFRQIQEAITQIEKVNTLLPQLSADQRKALAELINPEMPTLNQLFDKVLAIPGVSPVLKPTIDGLKPKLAALSTPAAPPTTLSLMMGGVDVGKQVTDSLNSLRSILEGITDAASAQAAFRQLQDVITQIQRYDVLFPQMSAEQRKALAAFVNAQMATLNPLFDKVLAIPGVAQLLKTTIDTLRPKLAVLTGAQTTAPPVLEIVIKEDKDNCIRTRRGQKPDPSCCVEKVRLVSGTAQITTNTGKVGNLTEVNTVACISPTGELTYSKSEESILPASMQVAQGPPAPEAPGGAPGGGAPGGGAPGGGEPGGGAPGGGGPPPTPISPPGGGGTTPPGGGGGGGPTPCVNPPTPNAPTCP